VVACAAIGGAAYYVFGVKKIDLSALLAKIKAGKREEEALEDEAAEEAAEEEASEVTDSQDEQTSEE